MTPTSVTELSVGITLLIGAALLHESEERRLQQILETWWLEIDYSRTRAIGREEAFVRTMLRVSERALGVLFGSSVLSLRSALVSAALCLMSLIECYTVVQANAGEIPSWHAVAGLAGLILFLVVIRQIHSLILVALVVFAIADVAVEMADAQLIAAVAFSSALLAGMLCDYLFIVSTRLLLKRINAGSSRRQLAVAVSVFLLLGTAALIWMLPWFVGHSIHELFTVLPIRSFWARSIVLFAGATNILIVLACTLFALVCVTMLLHRLLWPTIARPLYAIQRWRVFDNRKVIVGFGLGLIALAFGGPSLLGVIQALVR